MATGKYGMKINPYNQYGMNYSTGFSSTDPWYNIGALLGTIWANNYNKRGMQGGMDEAKQILDDMTRRQYGETIGDDSGYTTGVGMTNIGANSVGGLYQNTDQANAIGTGTGFTSGPLGSAVQPQQQGQQPPQQQDPTLTIGGQQIQPQNFIQAPLSAATTKYTDANESMGLPKSNIPNMNSDIAYASANQQMGLPEATTLTETIPRDLSAEKLDYIANKYSTSDNPDGDRAIVGMTANTVKNNIAQVNAGDVPIIDPKQYQAAIRAQLIKNGRTPYQIDQIIEMISPDIDSKVNSAKDLQFNRYYDLYKQQVQAGEYDKSALTYARMKQLNPTLAEGLSGQFKRNQSDFLTDYEIERTAQKYMKYDPTLSKRQAYNMALYKNPYSATEQIAMGAARVGGTGRGYSTGASYGAGTTRSSGGTKASKVATAQGKATTGQVGSYAGMTVGDSHYKALQEIAAQLQEKGANATSAEKQQLEDILFTLGQVEKAAAPHVPTYDEQYASVKDLMAQGAMPEELLDGIPVGSPEYVRIRGMIQKANAELNYGTKSLGYNGTYQDGPEIIDYKDSGSGVSDNQGSTANYTPPPSAGNAPVGGGFAGAMQRQEEARAAARAKYKKVEPELPTWEELSPLKRAMAKMGLVDYKH